jgi:hypothetical protein
MKEESGDKERKKQAGGESG